MRLGGRERQDRGEREEGGELVERQLISALSVLPNVVAMAMVCIRLRLVRNRRMCTCTSACFDP